MVHAAVRQGFEVTYSSKGHPMIRKDGRLVTTLSGSPSDVRALRNGIAALRRAGFVWPH
ncbi:hypothetical protein ACFVZ3_09950 [Kitasatospora purpeofusca]|uniref:hypothetical protein n=1 Tax=Kitasatospora purpeofusca TaxID=67352 RepID=UPI003689AD9D